jgi:hypothetical protein
MGWIGCDLDGVLADNSGPFDPTVVGPPIPEMVDRVKQWLADGYEVRIFTARVSSDGTDARNQDVMLSRAAIEAWCQENLGTVLPITNLKDYGMIELWDDRCVQVEPNTGKVVGYSRRGLHV